MLPYQLLIKGKQSHYRRFYFPYRLRIQVKDFQVAKNEFDFNKQQKQQHSDWEQYEVPKWQHYVCRHRQMSVPEHQMPEQPQQHPQHKQYQHPDSRHIQSKEIQLQLLFFVQCQPNCYCMSLRKHVKIHPKMKRQIYCPCQLESSQCRILLRVVVGRMRRDECRCCSRLGTFSQLQIQQYKLIYILHFIILTQFYIYFYICLYKFTLYNLLYIILVYITFLIYKISYKIVLKIIINLQIWMISSSKQCPQQQKNPSIDKIFLWKNDICKQKNSANLLIVMIITQLIILCNSTIMSTSLTTSSRFDLTLQLIQLGTSIPSSSLIIITLPPQFPAISLFVNKPYLSYDSLNDFCPLDCTTVTVSYYAYTFVIGNMFPITAPAFFSFTIFGLTNPMYEGLTDDIIVSIVSPDHLINYCTQTNGGFNIVARQFESISSSLSLPYLYSSSPLIMSIYLVKQMDYISLNFPTTKWQNQTLISTTIFDSIFVSSTSHQISFDKTNFEVNIYFPQIFIDGTILTFEINSIYTPSKVSPIGPISVLGFDYQGDIIRRSNVYVTSTQLVSPKLRNLKTLILYNQLANTIDVQTYFQLSTDALVDKIVLTYPSEITVAAIASSYQVFLTNTLVSATITVFSVRNSIEIILSLGKKFQPDFNVIMTINWPRVATQTSKFTIQTYKFVDPIYALMQGASCCAVWIKQKPTLIVSLILSSSERLKSSANYQFSISHSFSSLISSDAISIQFPTVYLMDISKQAVVCASATLSLISDPSNLNPSRLCTLSNNILTFKSIFISLQPPSLLLISINLDNPSISPNQKIFIYSSDLSGSIIQSNNAITVAITPAIVTSFVISTTSSVTYTTNTYTFQITTVGLVSKNQILKITIPTEVIVSKSSLSCQINGFSQDCTYDKATSTVQVLVITVVANSFQLNLINLVNPLTISQSSNFQINIYDTSSNLVQSSQSLATPKYVQMTQLSNFLYSRMQTSSLSLNSFGNLQFTIATLFSLKPSTTYKLVIVFSDTSMLNLSSSSLTVNSVTTVFTFTVSAPLLTVTMTFSPASITNIMVLVFSQCNIFQGLISSNVILSSSISSSFYSSSSLPSLLPLSSNPSAILISSYTISQSSYLLNQSPGTLILTISSFPLNISFAYILVSIPTNYVSPMGYVFNSTSNTIVITINVVGLLNPVEITQQPFTFVAYNNGQIVAMSQPTNQYFDVTCQLPCRTCKPTDNTLCADCYQITSIKMKYFRVTQSPYGVCTDHCIAGQYLDVTNNKCLLCSSNCSTCVISTGALSGDPQTCLTCSVGNYLYNSRCFAACSTGLYPNNLICSPCLSTCALCTSLLTCTQCISPYVFYQGLCVANCPVQTIAAPIGSTGRSQCLDCQANCAKCTDISTCVLCNFGYYLYNGICLAICPIVVAKQYYPNLSNQCVACQCLTCSVNSYTCISCPGGLILDNIQKTCLTSCEDGQFNNNGICQTCFSNCILCTSSSYCLKCIQPYILQISSLTVSLCVSSCPNTSILTIKTLNSTTHVLQCQACVSGCTNCTLSVSFCTACQSNYIFHNNKCLLTCSVGYYNISNVCRACAVECQACVATNAYNCTQCVQGYYLSAQFCYSVCPARTYREISLKKCLSCQALCQTCLNASHCTSCKSPYYLFTNNLCYDSCPKTPTFYYQYNSVCLSCQPQCDGCLSSPIQCVKCSSTIYYFNVDSNQCSTICQQGYFKKDLLCVKCLEPCRECDSTYDSCLKCFNNSTLKYLFQGTCLEQCPNGYYGVQNSTYYLCSYCNYPCKTCTFTQCLTCLSFAFMYKNTCVLDCSTTDLPYSKQTYCTNCLSIPFCTICSVAQTLDFTCESCSYPYVLFSNQCLNSCPIGYTTSSNSSVCVQSSSSLLLQEQKQQKTLPSIPFPFLISFMLISLILYPISSILYKYTYHIGYWIFLLNLADYLLVYIWILKQNQYYQGEYFDAAQKDVPFNLVVAGLVVNVGLLGWFAFGYTLANYYLIDVRYHHWRLTYTQNFLGMFIFFIIFGPKSHKLYYSKIFGLEIFSFRIVSVQKFHLQDRINFLSCFGDIMIIFGFLTIAYNVFIQYSVLYLSAFQILIIKILMWILLSIDSHKADRGFFMGDQKAAQQQILKQQQQQQQKLRRVDTQHLIKLIRQKSAGFLQYDHQPFGRIQKDQIISVYNPDDYQDVIKVPLNKIRRNIQKGKFRKGRRITIEEKLQRFADSIKPRPEVTKKDQYLHGMIYWRPPKQIKVITKKQFPPSQQSMLKLLQEKQLQYKDQLQQVSQIYFPQQIPATHNFRTGHHFYPSVQKQSYEQLQQSIQSIQQFEVLSSQVFKPKQDGYNQLMNLNYAKKKHLPKGEKKPKFDQNQMRILYHQPMKRRKSILQ